MPLVYFQQWQKGLVTKVTYPLIINAFFSHLTIKSMSRILVLFCLLVTASSFAQEAQLDVPKVLLHVQTADTMVYKSIVNQIGNIKKALPDAQVEVVCHGPGLNFLLKNAPYVASIDKMGFSGIQLVGCEYTMKSRNLQKSDLVPNATTVPFGIVELIQKQQQGWQYVKLGF